MNRTQKIFGFFFFASIALWFAFVVLIWQFVILAFANALIPGLLYSLVGCVFVFAALSTWAANAIREQATKRKTHYAYVPEASGWRCSYCQTVNNEMSAKCTNCGASKK